MKKILLLITFLSCTCKSLANDTKADFYISPDGDDSENGSIDTPFASLARARDAVRELSKASKDDITVLLRGGMYEVPQTVVFGLEDSGNETRSITYKSYPEETPILSAGTSLLNWKPFKGGKNSLPDLVDCNLYLL